MKIDVSKAFDTLSWEFLLKVLKAFGFHQNFCNQISYIIQSTNISISINGSQQGYLKCNRGVRQGDPLSSLLLCLAEEVLSRGIKKVVEEGMVDLIKSPRSTNILSHYFYVDDLMLFCKGKLSSLKSLKDLFTRYGDCSGQVVNLNKSSIFAGGVTHTMLNHMMQFLGFLLAHCHSLTLVLQYSKGSQRKFIFNILQTKLNRSLLIGRLLFSQLQIECNQLNQSFRAYQFIL